MGCGGARTAGVSSSSASIWMRDSTLPMAVEPESYSLATSRLSHATATPSSPKAATCVARLALKSSTAASPAAATAFHPSPSQHLSDAQARPEPSCSHADALV